jgi:transposase
MSNLFWLTDAQMERLRPFFPKSHGKPRVDDRRVLSGIIFINRNGLRWCDAPREYGPPKTLYNRWKRWGDMGVFARMMEGLASEGGQEKVVMIDATYLKAHRTASSLRAKRGARRQARPPHRANEGRAEHQAARGDGCRWPPVAVLHDGGPGQRLHRRGGAPRQPACRRMADRGPGIRCRLVPGSVERQRDTSMHPGPEVARQGRPLRQAPIQRRNRIEIMFGRLKDWRRIATRYDRCPKVFLSAVALAATVLFWL